MIGKTVIVLVKRARVKRQATITPPPRAVWPPVAGGTSAAHWLRKLQAKWLPAAKLCGGELAAGGCNRDMRHRRIGLGPMQVALAGLDVHDIADGDLALFRVRRDRPSARRDHQDLVTVVGMPPGSRAIAKVNHVTPVVIGVSVADDRLPRPAHRSAAPPANGRGGVHRFFRQIVNSKYTHVGRLRLGFSMSEEMPSR